MDGKIGDRRAEIYTYESDNIVYGLSWSVSHFSSSMRAQAWLPRSASSARLVLSIVSKIPSLVARPVHNGCLISSNSVLFKGSSTRHSDSISIHIIALSRNIHLILCFCEQNRRDKRFRLAVGSFLEERNNHVEIITRASLLPLQPHIKTHKHNAAFYACSGRVLQLCQAPTQDVRL